MSQGAPPQSDSYLKYFIAASVVGACIGNMFVARRMRGIMKMKVPTADSTTAAGWAPPSGAHQQQTVAGASQAQAGTRAEEEAARSRQAQRARDFNYQRDQQEQVHEAYRTWARTKYDPKLRPRHGGMQLEVMVPFLRALSLPTTQLPSKKEVKDAFQKIAMMCHPDVVPEDNPERNTRLKSKFTEANEAYKYLLQKIDSLSP